MFGAFGLKPFFPICPILDRTGGAPHFLGEPLHSTRMNFSCSIAALLSALGLVGLVSLGHVYRHQFQFLGRLGQPVDEEAEWPMKKWHEKWHKSMGERWMCKERCAGDEESNLCDKSM